MNAPDAEAFNEHCLIAGRNLRAAFALKPTQDVADMLKVAACNLLDACEANTAQHFPVES